MNRVQNKTILSKCAEESDTWSCQLTWSFQEPQGWMDPATPVLYNSEGSVITIWSKLENDGLHYPHVAMIDANGLTYLTFGEMVVTDILSWQDDTVYLMGTGTKSPGSRHLYRWKEGETRCLTCSVLVSIIYTCFFCVSRFVLFFFIYFISFYSTYTKFFSTFHIVRMRQ